MLFVIGDIHGHADKLVRLMDHCRGYGRSRGQASRFILLGDLIDRGPASADVVQYLDANRAGVTSLKGNHEDLFLRALDDDLELPRFIENGGGDTLASYGAGKPNEIPPRHLDLISQLPAFIDDGARLFVHAGIDPADPMARDEHVLMWTRQHPPDTAVLPRFIVHGHTPTRNRLPDLRPNRLNLDTGAGWGAALTAAGFDDSRIGPICFITDGGKVTPLPGPDHRPLK